MDNRLKQQNNVNDHIRNFLILIMVLFFGFTSLRFGMFGIGEVILLLFCLTQMIGKQMTAVSIENHSISIFWILFLGCITYGYAVNNLLNISPQSALFDYRAYVVIFFLCFTFESIFKHYDFTDLYRLLRVIYFVGLFVIGFLYLLFIIGITEIQGYYLTYGGGEDIFSPFANDYHQFAYFVTPLPFIGLYIISKEKRAVFKILALLGVFISIKVGMATTSNTLVASWALTSLLFCFLVLVRKLRQQKKPTYIIFIFTCLLLDILLISYQEILTQIHQYFESSSNGENRIIIWSNAIKAWGHSPIVGLGPGSYSGEEVFGGYEAHNTFLQVLTQGGVIGGMAYILLVLRLTKVTSINTFILCGVISLVIYGFGINDLRRTVLWFYFVLFYFLSLKSKGEES